MKIRTLKSERDHRVALKQIEGLMNAKRNTDEGELLDVLTTLVESYEREHFPMDLPDPVEAIKFTMEQQGLSIHDLEPMIGRPNRVYEILNRRRPLTLKMIRRLNQGLGIPAESLLQLGDRG